MYSLVEKMRERLTEKGLYKEGDEDGRKVRTIVGCESLLVSVCRRQGNPVLTCVLATDGHMGDSNLHINICAKQWDSEVEEAIEPLIYELTCASLNLSSHSLHSTTDVLSLLRSSAAAEKGSISAEHGLGVMKAPHIHYSKSADAIAMMQAMKKLLDPKNTLNPYKYILP